MDVPDALSILGVDPDLPWPDIRHAYRDLLMANHPDHAQTLSRDEAADRTDAIVEAFRLLREVTGDGAVPLAIAPARPDTAPETPLVLHAPPGDVFMSVYEAATRIGYVTYADRQAGLLQIMLDPARWPPSQLTAEIASTQGPSGPVTTALFSLDATGVDPAPPIDEVVATLARGLGTV